MTDAGKKEFWAIVELMGHQRIAGKVSEETIGGAALLRVDVAPNATARPRLPNSTATRIYMLTTYGQDDDETEAQA